MAFSRMDPLALVGVKIRLWLQNKFVGDPVCNLSFCTGPEQDAGVTYDTFLLRFSELSGRRRTDRLNASLLEGEYRDRL
jgi:hypothetical protein